MSNSRGKLVIIAAPSGTGKDTVISCIKRLRPEIAVSVSVTTREPRKGEVDGEAYFFVTRDVFQKMIDKGEFLEFAEYVGQYYGTPIAPIKKHIDSGRNVILKIEIQGARQIKKMEPDVLTIFVVPPDMKELERRLRGRGTDSNEQIQARLQRAHLELAESVHYDHIVVNDDVMRAAKEIIAIIDKTNENQNRS